VSELGLAEEAEHVREPDAAVQDQLLSDARNERFDACRKIHTSISNMALMGTDWQSRLAEHRFTKVLDNELHDFVCDASYAAATLDDSLDNIQIAALAPRATEATIEILNGIHQDAAMTNCRVAKKYGELKVLLAPFLKSYKEMVPDDQREPIPASSFDEDKLLVPMPTDDNLPKGKKKKLQQQLSNSAAPPPKRARKDPKKDTPLIPKGRVRKERPPVPSATSGALEDSGDNREHTFTDDGHPTRRKRARSKITGASRDARDAGDLLVSFTNR
jgi:hypothetical protein